MGDPFVGSEALARGLLSRHQLRTQYRAVLPNVYLPKQIQPSLGQRIAAAWLWSDRRGIIAGNAAAALHGAKWIDDNVPVELIHANPRAPQGVLTRRDVLLEGEVQTLAGRAVTTPERTAFDIGRRALPRSAVARLDALARATGFKVDSVMGIAACHRGARGLRQLETVLELVDPGAQSPRESYLRLLLIDAGLPRPHTQIPVFGVDGFRSLTSIWAGQISWSPSNTTVTTIELTDSSTSKTFAGWSSWNGWGGSSSGWSPKTGPPKSCEGCGTRWKPGVRVCNDGLECALRAPRAAETAPTTHSRSPRRTLDERRGNRRSQKVLVGRTRLAMSTNV